LDKWDCKGNEIEAQGVVLIHVCFIDVSEIEAKSLERYRNCKQPAGPSTPFGAKCAPNSAQDDTFIYQRT
jgi:hypothetical protein